MLTIVDAGIGIDSDKLEHPDSHGNLGMRQRTAQCEGEFTIDPGPDGVGRDGVRAPASLSVLSPAASAILRTQAPVAQLD